MLFLPSIDQTVLTGTIFLTMTVINLIIPLVWLIVFWVLSVQVCQIMDSAMLTVTFTSFSDTCCYNS